MPRRLMVPAPTWPWAVVENWLLSPSTGPLTGRDLIRSTVVGEPRRASSSLETTSTGRAASSGVPRMKEPVTTTSSTVVLCCAFAGAGDRASMAAMAQPPQYCARVIGILPRRQVVSPGGHLTRV